MTQNQPIYAYKKERIRRLVSLINSANSVSVIEKLVVLIYLCLELEDLAFPKRIASQIYSALT